MTNSVSDALLMASIEVDQQMKSTKVQRITRIAGVVAIVAIFAMMTVFADPSGEIQSGIKDGTKQLYGIMTAVIVPVAAVFFAWNAFKVLFGGERGMDQARKQMLTIVIVLALVWLAPLIVNQVSGWFSSSGDGGVFD